MTSRGTTQGPRRAQHRSGHRLRSRALRQSSSGVPNSSLSPTPTPKKPKGESTPYYEEPTPAPTDVYVTNVPAEFRRIELFIAGTVPNRSLLPIPDDTANANATRSPTPLDQTWQDGSEPQDKQPSGRISREPADEPEKMVTLMICPLTGMRATVNCPDKQARTFRAGTEPKEFCTFHR